MNIPEACENIIELYEDTTNKGHECVILGMRLVSELSQEARMNGISPADLTRVLETTKRVLSTKRKHRQSLGEELLKHISYLPYTLWHEEENPQFERGMGSEEGKIAEALIRFAHEIYAIKLDRDAFAGKMRGYAVELLGCLSQYFEVPEFMDLCAKSLRSKSKNEFLMAVESLKEHHKGKNTAPDEAMLDIIDERIKKSKDKSEVVSGLDLQVETGVISEISALFTLDDWKEKHGRY